MEDDLFSTAPVAPTATSGAPVVVVGLPRSGSSFLSHVLSQFPNYYVFDDLYLLERAHRFGAEPTISTEQMRKLLVFLGWQIRARLRFGKYAIPNVTEEEVEPMNAALAETFAGQTPTPLDLQEEWMIRLAHRSGATKWGFKMPGAFRELDRLRDRYPDLKVIFLMRQPHDVLASYKHMPSTSQDGDPERYHPVAYAYYWRSAARALLAQQSAYPDSTFFVNFSDLTGSPETVSQRLAGFLGETAPDYIAQPEKPNSSHGGGGARKTLTGLETAITNRTCGREIAALGFETRTGKPGAGDLWDMLSTSGRFLRFHLRDVMKRFRPRRAAPNAVPRT